MRLLALLRQFEVRLEELGEPEVCGDEVDEVAVGRVDRRDFRFLWTDSAIEALAMKRRCAVERPDTVVGDEAHRADGGPVDYELRIGERTRLGIDDEVDLPLVVQRHVLRAMASRATESHRFEERGERSFGLCPDGELDEREP